MLNYFQTGQGPSMSCNPTQMEPCQISYLWIRPTADYKPCSWHKSINRTRQKTMHTAGWRLLHSWCKIIHKFTTRLFSQQDSNRRSFSRSGLSWISHRRSNLDNSAAGSWMFCSTDFFGLYRPNAGFAAARIETRAFRLVMIPACNTHNSLIHVMCDYVWCVLSCSFTGWPSSSAVVSSSYWPFPCVSPPGVAVIIYFLLWMNYCIYQWHHCR